jgi:hypothetical protein
MWPFSVTNFSLSTGVKKSLLSARNSHISRVLSRCKLYLGIYASCITRVVLFDDVKGNVSRDFYKSLHISLSKHVFLGPEYCSERKPIRTFCLWTLHFLTSSFRNNHDLKLKGQGNETDFSFLYKLVRRKIPYTNVKAFEFAVIFVIKNRIPVS